MEPDTGQFLSLDDTKFGGGGVVQHERVEDVALFEHRVQQHVEVMAALIPLSGAVERLAEAIARTIERGGKLLLCGNGGSAADCQHMAAEFVNRLARVRPPMPAIALTTDSSLLTSLANDTSFDHVFSRQVEALARPPDIVLGISTSGQSRNVLNALECARALGVETALLTGKAGAGARADHLLAVPSGATQRVQEAHLFLEHYLCERVEELVMEKEKTGGRTGSSAEAGGANYFVHPSSYVDEGVTIGAGTKIWFFCHIQRGARIGEHCILGQNVNIDRDAVVGNRVKIQNNVSVYKGVIVEDDVFLGPSMVLTNVVNPRSHVSRKHEFKETRICKGATVGANATIVCGHTVGRYAFVGAGAVVTRDVPDHALVLGNPARVRGWMCQCGVKLEFGEVDGSGTARARCRDCGATYVKNGTRVALEGDGEEA